ncbi:MaoC-like dehydratase [marine gamma proteobacterium HTCC2143]|jgi:acyl dehydratase|uniref:MaoC-like dehydratase n=1 Tax=marine gamma proteobacterium HTCC2143 TaxID=247633 RepID=A0Y866_9GAMM|nr:MaoC-like dehydratase [marine gamma proteobacterium HTCC2143]|tara:strand:+ start:2347 stop:2748 length:402 start_codon:yes stop_codon:yes gene_type:complete
MTDISVGTEIPALKLPPITRTTLALYAGASGDHNPVHIDSDFAKKAGMPDVFAHGMLSMAYLGRMLTNWQSQAKLKRFSNRFASITHLQDVITCIGKVVELVEQDGETVARCEIQAIKATGEQTLVGEALVAI